MPVNKGKINMKNIHVIPTDKPSRLFKFANQLHLDTIPKEYYKKYQIYITSNEEIKEGIDQWYLDKVLNEPYNSGGAQYSLKQDVIILTTDQDLIADGVQAIDDEFVEWFIKNPNCEEVVVDKPISRGVPLLGYKIIIPKEETKQENCCTPIGQIKRYVDCKGCDRKPKQETQEEAAEKQWGNVHRTGVLGFIDGAKWQQERSYSEVEVEQIARFGFNAGRRVELKAVELDFTFEKWFEQFKKK
jgi:hypothetical protein